MTFIYALLAFILGLLLGWFLWGRQRGELDELRGSLDRLRGENDKLRSDTTRLNDELQACGRARSDLERMLQEAKAATSPTVSASASLAAAPSSSPLAKSEKTKAAKTGTAKTKVAKPSAKDDLRRLIGIGPVNERKLNEHGITTFAEIASWTAADIRRVEEYLEFDGRIKREKWVQQAKLLAAGKEDEFARRFPTAGSSDNT